MRKLLAVVTVLRLVDLGLWDNDVDNPDAVGLRVRGASREVDTPPVISDKAAGSRQV